LTQSIERRGFIVTPHSLSERTHPPGSFLEALWLTLSPRLGREDLTVDNVASLIGLSRKTLQRRLKASDTSLMKELMQLKQPLLTTASTVCSTTASCSRRWRSVGRRRRGASTRTTRM